MSSGSANKVNSPEDPDFAGVEGGEPVTAATSDRFSSKTSSKVGLDGFNRHVHSILDKVLDSPLPPSNTSVVTDPAVAAALAADREGGPDMSAVMVTEVEAEGQNPSLHFCKLCQVWISGELNCQAHLSGRKHIKRARLYQQMQQKGMGGTSQDVESAESAETGALDSLANGPKVCSSVLMPVSEADTSMVPLYKCNLCDITATSLDHLEAHYRGVKHQKRLALEAMKTGGEASAIMTETLQGKPICPGAAFHCTVCGITCSSLENLQTHCKGRKHIRRLSQSKQRGGGPGSNEAEDPMATAMAAASASLAAMSIGRHHQQHQQQQASAASRRSSDGVGVTPHSMPAGMVPPAMYLHSPLPHQMMAHHHPPHHQMMGLPQDFYHPGMPPMMPPEMYGYHLHQMPPHPTMAYMPSAGGPWPAAPTHHHAAAYMGWPGQAAAVPPPPPRHQQLLHGAPQPYRCLVEEVPSSVIEVAGDVRANEEEEDVTAAKVGDVSSGSIHSSAGTVVELSSVQQVGEMNSSVLVASGEPSDDEDGDDELCLSSGRSTPVAFYPEGQLSQEHERDGGFGRPFEFSSQRGHHRRGMSDPGIDLNDVSLALTSSAEEGASGTPHHPRFITSHLSLDHLAQQELGRLSLSFDVSLGVDANPLRRVSGASSDEQASEGGKRISNQSVASSSAAENAHEPFYKATGRDHPLGNAQLGPAIDPHVLSSLSPFADRRLSPIGGSQRTHGCHHQRPSSTGDDVITAPPPATGPLELGWHHQLGGSFDSAVPPPAPPPSAASSPARSRGHFRSQSLGVLSLAQNASDSGFSFALHHPDVGGIGCLPEHSTLPHDPLVGARPAENKVNRFIMHQRHASEASSSLASSRPPLYKTYSASSGSSVAAAPAAGLGIWAMTESDRKRSSSGSWEEACAAAGGSSPDDSGDASLLSDKSRLSDSKLDSAALVIPEASVATGLTPTAAAFPLAPLAETDDSTHHNASSSVASGVDNKDPGSSALHFCSICGVSATSAAHLEAHFQGKRHQRTLANMYRVEGGASEQGGLGSSGSTARFFCPVCNVSATSEGHLESHFKGRQHARKSAALASGSPLGSVAAASGSTQLYHCGLCGVTATSSDHLVSHFRGKQHARKMRLATEGTGMLLHSPPPPPPQLSGQPHHHHHHQVPFGYPPAMASPELAEAAWMMSAGGYFPPPHPMGAGWWPAEMAATGGYMQGMPSPPPEGQQWMVAVPMMQHGWHA